jgi:hypothetical protein
MFTTLSQIYLQGGIDHEGNVNARVNQAWTASNVTKVQAQVALSQHLQLPNTYRSI